MTAKFGYTDGGRLSRQRWLKEYYRLCWLYENQPSTYREMWENYGHLVRPYSTKQVSKQTIQSYTKKLRDLGLVTVIDEKSASHKKEFALSEDGERLLKHDCRYDDGKCTICGREESWNIDKQKIEDVAKEPEQYRIRNEAEEQLEEEIRSIECIDFMTPESPVCSAKDIVEEIDWPNNSKSNYWKEKQIREKLDELVNEGKIATHPVIEQWYILPDIDIKIRDGEYREITVPQNNDDKEHDDGAEEQTLREKLKRW